MIRIATLDDVMMAVDWVEYLCRAVDGQMAVNRPWTANVVANLIQSPEALVLISGNADRGGMLAASLQPTVINPAKVAMEHAWVANDRSGIRLLRAFEEWAGEQGAVVGDCGAQCFFSFCKSRFRFLARSFVFRSVCAFVFSSNRFTKIFRRKFCRFLFFALIVGKAHLVIVM